MMVRHFNNDFDDENQNEINPLGYCPTCGAPGVERERRLNGNDTCKNGHVYPSKDARKERLQDLSVELAEIKELNRELTERNKALEKEILELRYYIKNSGG